MRVSEFIEHLKMFGEDTVVYVQTTPDDLCQPISRKLLSVMPANYDDRYKLTPHRILITAFIPHESTK